MGIQNLNINPYHDDFDETKNFHRILFRPGYAVQARELTQLQTILQNQVTKFGRHIFREGSIVAGGEITYSPGAYYVKIQANDTNGDLINVTDFDGKIIGNDHSYSHDGGIAKVVAVESGDSINAASLIIQYTTTSTKFQANSAIYTLGDTTKTAITVDSGTFSGNASIMSIANGVFFIYDHFVSVNPQTIVLAKDTASPSYRVGLQISDEIVDELEDSTLLDPALNASNYQAPGATRLKISATLSKRTLDSTDDSSFIELARIENGVLTKLTKYPEYAELEKTLARRTFDESGDYTVNPFMIEMKDHVPTPGNTSNSSLFTTTLSPGKAYVHGFEFETISPTNFDVSRARATQNVNNRVIDTTYGNYFIGANVSGLFDISTMQTVDLHCVTAGNITTTNATTYGSTTIGTARFRQIGYSDSANTQLANTYQYEVYVFDTRFSPITGNATSGTTNTITLAASGAAAATSNAYLGAYLRITTGTGADNTPRKITNYVASTRVVTVDSIFSATPTTNSVYSIDFSIKDLESVVVKAGTSNFSANADVDISNKVGSVDTGDAFLSDTDYNALIFKVPNDLVSFNMADQSYRGKQVFPLESGFVSNTVTITATGGNFVGSGSLSDANKLEHFYVVTKTAAAGLAANSVVPMTAAGRTITVTGPVAQLDLKNNEFTQVSIVASVDYTYASSPPKTKALNLANTTNVAVSSGTTIGNTTIYTSHCQVAITTPNKIAGNSDCLYVSDIHKLEGKFEKEYGYFTVLRSDGTTTKSSFKVVDSGNSIVDVVTADLSDSTKDITYKYILDDGQRDGYYDHGNIILRPGVSPPRGRLLILFNYFTHSGSGFLTVDSYKSDSNLGANTTIRYAKIPTYTSPTTGKVYSLRDSIDFRPRRQDLANTLPNFTLSGIAIPKENESLISDYAYYVGRTDRLVLKSERQFELIQGISDVVPQTPQEPDNAMTLYTLNVPPYTFFPGDVKANFFRNRRYTMKDIGKIEKRVENLEYYTTLSMLEKDAKNITLTDADGMIRYKNGFLVDSFVGHGIGDVSNLDYKCSIDSVNGELRPSFLSSSISFDIDTANTTSNLAFNTIGIAPYTVTPAIEQNIASTKLKINEFLFTNFVGVMRLSPAGDVWVDHQQRPDVLVNLEGNNDAWESIGSALNDSRAPGWYTAYNDWTTYSTSSSSYTEEAMIRSWGQTTEEREGPDGTNGIVYTAGGREYASRTITNTTTSQYRNGVIKTLVPERIEKSIGKRQVDLSIIPYIRAQKVYGIGNNMAPNSLIYAYFDGTNVSKFIESPSILRLYNLTGTFKDEFGNWETITSSSGGTAKVIKQVGQSWSLADPRLYIVDVTGTFAVNDTVTGSVSGATAKIDIPTIISGPVTSATSDAIVLSTGMPYNNIYSDFANTSNTLISTNTFYNTQGVFDFAGLTPAGLNSAFGYNKIRIVSGKGLGQERTIISYNGSTKTANLSSSWTVIPDSTSVFCMGNLQTDDIGLAAGIFHLPSYNATSYDSGYKFRTGTRKFRLCDDPDNDENKIYTFADVDFFASGLLNTFENVSVSVRVPGIQTKSIQETRQLSSTSVGWQTNRTVYDPIIPYYQQGGGGGGGGGCKIICTKLHELGYLSDNIYQADEMFGQYLRENDPYAYYGYIKWASVVVDWMENKGPSFMFWIRDKNMRNEKQRNLVINWARRIATPWAEHMAHKMGVGKTDNRAGRLIMKTGLWISRTIGKYSKTTKPTKNITLAYIMWAVFGIFWLLAGVK